MVLALVPPALALLVLGAHFLRAGNVGLVAAALGAVGLLFVRRAWAARLVEVALALGALEWLRTLALLVYQRRAAGAPFVRMALILGGVALGTGLSLLAFRRRAAREHFRPT